ncbi:GrdX family protein [Clostridium sp. JN-9]|uniref:GrdX family protein n=1 Tax=Clostridium sp. JN-9 TaxID=2507159 RepID=UPI000FFE2BEE|nr:GrdX family protein [Clostridium sp. JN-9]QAT39056.1 GrdX protein [Clostridium sp. JN-9]
MIEQFIAITNNPLSKENLEKKYDVEFISSDTMAVLKKVRDYIHKGHKLLTHPLMSSIKPNETPYRTILISKNSYNKVDYDSLTIMEEAIITTEKFLKMGKAVWDEQVLEDFRVIDYDMIYHVIN